MAVTRLNPATQGDARYYVLDDGTKLPSVTSILSIIAKPKLVGWAANKEREFVVREATLLWQEMHADGATCPGVSSFSAALNDRLPSKRAHDRIVDTASGLGDSIHKYVENYLLDKLGYDTKPLTLTPDTEQMAAGFRRWAEEVNLKPLLVEAIVFNTKIGYGGTLDAVVELDTPDEGRIRCVTDWKTSSGVYKEMWLQVGAYANTDMASSCAAVDPSLRETDLATDKMHGMIVRIDKKKRGVVEPTIMPPEFVAKSFRKFCHAKQLWDDMKAEES